MHRRSVLPAGGVLILVAAFCASRAVPALAPPTSIAAAPEPNPVVHRITGRIVDAQTQQLLPARLYIQGADGSWHFPVADDGDPTRVVRYTRKNYWNAEQAEMHATLAAGPFEVELPPADYTVTVERGKEYLPLVTKVRVDADQPNWRLPVTRWIDMAARGWYSGDSHCHRATAELSNILLAEDLNVCFPQTYWTTSAELPPSQGDKTAADIPRGAPVTVDATHVWYPRNTEYEIFKTAGRDHTLGAFLVLNHQTPFDMPCPPLGAVVEQARREGALIDLEKHNWEWAAIIAPVMPVDLFELANNHNWRIAFGIKNWGAPAAKWMALDGPLTIDNEADWLEYGWQAYYALLNSGLAINPTAGSASGAHPVPVGHGRVYVHLPRGFSYADWIAGLKAGRSFVTTGPMLMATVNGKDPGETFDDDAAAPLRIEGEVRFTGPVSRIEVIWNGAVVHNIVPSNESDGAAVVTGFNLTRPADASGWLALRCVAPPTAAGGIPFAHTAPWHVKIPGRPLRPKKREVQYFLDRVEQEIARNQPFLTAPQLADYLTARTFWQSKLHEAE